MAVYLNPLYIGSGHIFAQSTTGQVLAAASAGSHLEESFHSLT